ncbi:hypothetical protein WS72_13545 [Burkholderia savannae]|uniref:Uncharacterized protein n=1 Tax=Burkholderia savannae TaxID=1637837 RepID=A0ABR5TFJ9_9BURK|nr:hypothetical protein WS72_13545 [Burkholderia savannae]
MSEADCGANERVKTWLPSMLSAPIASCAYMACCSSSMLMLPRPQRRHDGKVALTKSIQRWCSDGFEFRCDNDEPLRGTFALDRCDREVMNWEATTCGH